VSVTGNRLSDCRLSRGKAERSADVPGWQDSHTTNCITIMLLDVLVPCWSVKCERVRYRSGLQSSQRRAWCDHECNVCVLVPGLLRRVYPCVWSCGRHAGAAEVGCSTEAWWSEILWERLQMWYKLACYREDAVCRTVPLLLLRGGVHVRGQCAGQVVMLVHKSQKSWFGPCVLYLRECRGVVTLVDGLGSTEQCSLCNWFSGV
jgi:hypothetical protein